VNRRLAIVVGITILILLRYCGAEDEKRRPKTTDVSWASAKSVPDCDRKYDEATRKQKVPNGSIYTLTFSMDSEGFFEKCAEGNSGPWSEPCYYYQQCIASVKNNLTPTRKMDPLSYAATAEYVRDYLVKSNILKPTTINAMGKAENIKNACSNIDYPGLALQGMIYGNIPEVADLEIAGQLATKARDGYGECICVIADHVNVEIDMSIGKCVADTFVQY